MYRGDCFPTWKDDFKPLVSISEIFKCSNIFLFVYTFYHSYHIETLEIVNMTFPFRCALHIAVSVGKYDVAKWLVEECSAEIHLKDLESGWNALHRSLFYGNIDCAILLLKV